MYPNISTTNSNNNSSPNRGKYIGTSMIIPITPLSLPLSNTGSNQGISSTKLPAVIPALLSQNSNGNNLPLFGDIKSNGYSNSSKSGSFLLPSTKSTVINDDTTLSSKIGGIKLNIMIDKSNDIDPYDTDLLIDHQEIIQKSNDSDSDSENILIVNVDGNNMKEEGDNFSDVSSLSSFEYYDSDDEDNEPDYEEGISRDILIEELQEENEDDYQQTLVRLEQSVQIHKEYSLISSDVPRINQVLSIDLKDFIAQIELIRQLNYSEQNYNRVMEMIKQIDSELNHYETLVDNIPYAVRELNDKLSIANRYTKLKESSVWQAQKRRIPMVVQTYWKNESLVSDTPLILTDEEINLIIDIVNHMQIMINEYENTQAPDWVNQRRDALALKQIRDEQRRTDSIIPKDSFKLLVKEILQDKDIGIESEAIEALQLASEGFLIDLFEQANQINVLCYNKKRKLLEQNNYELDDPNVTLQPGELEESHRILKRSAKGYSNNSY